MDTRNATPGDEILPGNEFRDRNGRLLPEFISASGHPARIVGRWTVRHIVTTGSTNDDLVRAARSGAPDHLVLVADHQTAGRGRLDRRWDAPPGDNLLVSILFRSVPQRPHQLTHIVALAAVGACRHVMSGSPASTEVALKWPNDVLIGARKLAGILASAGPPAAERTSDTGAIPEWVVVGLGLNVRWAPKDAVNLSEFANGVHRDDVLAHFLAVLDVLVDMDPEDVHAQYRLRLSTIGKSVRLDLPSGDVLEGRALDVGLDGRLAVLDSCAVTHRIDVADVVHLRLTDRG